MTGKTKTELYKSKRKHYEQNDKRFTYLKYDKNKLPYEYANGDICCMFDNDEEGIEAQLIEWGILKADPNEPKRIDYTDEDAYDEATDNYYNEENEKREQYYKYKTEIIDPYMRAYKEKDYRAYCCYGACFWWNTTFCLELAQMVMPSVVWKIKRSHIHATITSEDEKLVFDILYYKQGTADFGGREAINDTNNKIEWSKHNAIQYEILNSNTLTEQKKEELLYIRDRKYNKQFY